MGLTGMKKLAEEERVALPGERAPLGVGLAVAARKCEEASRTRSVLILDPPVGYVGAVTL